MKNILSENMQRFGTKNLTESNVQKLNEDVYEELKADPSPANVAKVIYNAKGMFNDSEAHVVAALQACKTYADWSAAAKVFQSLYGKTIIMYMAGFLTSNDLFNKQHAGSTAGEELERLYGSSYEEQVGKYFKRQSSVRHEFDRAKNMASWRTQAQQNNTKSGY